MVNNKLKCTQSMTELSIKMYDIQENILLYMSLPQQGINKQGMKELERCS